MTSKKERFYIQRIAELEEQVAKLIKVNAELADKVAKLSKNSPNSSKPPSSDIVKPAKSKPTTGSARQGGQPGHKGISRQPFEPNQIDETIPLHPGDCDCGYTGCGKPIKKPKIQPTVELVEKPVRITEFHLHGFICPACGRVIWAKLPVA